ncbi:MAG: acetate/propionate family kinase, partial [Acidimicrobiia bacterium]|nr:acetate/propionate family kinase [Acidimicrobiia bacterium]
MRLLVVNAGSSSLKLSMLDDHDRVAHHTVDGWDGEDTDAIATFVGDAGPPPEAVAHRVVHGGERFTEPVLIDDDVLVELRQLTALAPLHQPRSLAGVAAAREVLADVAHVACFDTSFHATLSAAASTYALPAEWRQLGIRRYGFHGLSHAWAAQRAADLVGRPVDDLRIVVAHLGAGASLCAVSGGRSVDTTMGFTPLEGVVMATRSGTVDPA